MKIDALRIVETRGIMIVVVIAAFNEEKTIRKVVRDVQRNGYTAVVVDDGSSDRTAAVLQFKRRVIVLRHLLNRGQGAALRTGMRYAVDELHADVIVTFDGDDQFDAREIARVVEPILQRNADVVFGSRFR